MAALAASVALGYFVIAFVVAPRIKMPSVSGGLVLDMAAPIGGDEFAIILREADGADATAAAARIIAAAAAPPTGGIPATSVSAGSAPISGSLNPADIMRRADLALYSAKRSGGDCYAGSKIAPPEHVA